MFGVNPFKVDEEVKINAENYCKSFEKEKKKNFFFPVIEFRELLMKEYICARQFSLTFCKSDYCPPY